MTVVETLLFVGWIGPVLFIGASAIFVSRILEHKKAGYTPPGTATRHSMRSSARASVKSAPARNANRIRQIAQESVLIAN